VKIYSTVADGEFSYHGGVVEIKNHEADIADDHEADVLIFEHSKLFGYKPFATVPAAKAAPEPIKDAPSAKGS